MKSTHEYNVMIVTLTLWVANIYNNTLYFLLVKVVPFPHHNWFCSAFFVKHDLQSEKTIQYYL
jgi:hypothetical protein